MKQIRLQFNINLKPEVLSGKYKVQTEYGTPVEIVKWDCKGKYPILACIDNGYVSDSCFYTAEGIAENKNKLVMYYEIEETELEKVLEDLFFKIDQDFNMTGPDFDDYIKEYLPKIREAVSKDKEQRVIPQAGPIIAAEFKESVGWLVDKAYAMGKENQSELSKDNLKESITKSLLETSRKGVGAIILKRDNGESASDYLLRCLGPELRNVWYEACDEIRG